MVKSVVVLVMKINYSRHELYKTMVYITRIYVNTVPFRITALWWISILFTTPDKFTTLYKNSPHWKLTTTTNFTTLPKHKILAFCLPLSLWWSVTQNSSKNEGGQQPTQTNNITNTTTNHTADHSLTWIWTVAFVHRLTSY